MNVVYSKKNYIIIKIARNSFILYNRNKNFNEGHTYINNFNTAKYILHLSLSKGIPEKHISNYLLESIIRVSTDISYINKIKCMKK